jgi:uncharacterized protein (TIGR02646 family)
MYRITKGSEPKQLGAARASKQRYRDLDPATKQAMRDALVAEQRGVCCYCNDRIRADEVSMRIEHRVHQRHPVHGEARSLEWGNLLGSCYGNEGASRDDMHCDPRKSDLEIALDPTDPNIEERLRFLPGGALETTDAVHAVDLETLNLNKPVFVRNRGAVLAAFQQSLKAGTIDAKKMAVLARSHVVEKDGQLLPFGAIVTYWARKKLRRAGAPPPAAKK